MKTIFFIAYSLVGVVFTAAAQQTAVREVRKSESVLPLIAEPPPKLIVDQPLPEPLAQGKVIIPYQTENLRIVSLFGTNAADVSPRIGHLHVTVDDAPWHWAHAGNDQPLIIVGLPAGSHKVLVEMADPAHKIIESKVVSFTIPASKETATSHSHQH